MHKLFILFHNSINIKVAFDLAQNIDHEFWMISHRDQILDNRMSYAFPILWNIGYPLNKTKQSPFVLLTYAVCCNIPIHIFVGMQEGKNAAYNKKETPLMHQLDRVNLSWTDKRSFYGKTGIVHRSTIAVFENILFGFFSYQAVCENEPSFLVTLDVVRPLVEPAFRFRRRMILIFCRCCRCCRRGGGRGWWCITAGLDRRHLCGLVSLGGLLQKTYRLIVVAPRS